MKTVTNYLLMCIVAIAMFVGYGCSQDGVLDNHWNQEMQMSESEKYVKQVHYDTYLSIDRDKIVYKELTDEEIRILGAAFMRITYEEKNGLLYIKQSSGREVNISEQIYGHFADLANEYNNNRTKYAPKTIRTRSNDYTEEPTEDADGEASDCVARSLGYIATQMEGNYKYEDLMVFIEENYENGVSTQNIGNILDEFCKQNSFENTPANYSDLVGFIPDRNQQAMLNIRKGDPWLHAVVLFLANTTHALYIDPQRNEDGEVGSDQVYSAYIIRKL